MYTTISAIDMAPRTARKENFPVRLNTWELLVLRHKATQSGVSPCEKLRDIIKGWESELTDFERRMLLEQQIERMACEKARTPKARKRKAA
jgi:hypothetical protein